MAAENQVHIHFMCSSGIDSNRVRRRSNSSPTGHRLFLINLSSIASLMIVGPSFPAMACVFISIRPAPADSGGQDIYVSKRASVCDPWGPAKNLGPTVNSTANDQTAAISPDGRRLYFASDRSGGFGGLDIYVSTRKNKRDDFAWGPPENLGSAVNTTQPEFVGSLVREKRPRREVLYFARGAVGERDLYLTRRYPDGSFEAAIPVEELNGSFDDARPTVRRDGLEMFFDSNRPGTGRGRSTSGSPCELEHRTRGRNR